MTRASFRQCRQFARGANPFYQLLRSDTINGFAIGRKIVQGKTTSDLAITVFVKRKLSLRRLPLARRIPQILRLPDDGAPDGALEFITDVQEATFHALAYTARERLARSGISIGHAAITAGTLGGLVRDRETGAVAILSNNHVLANSNQGALGDAILQPGAADGGADPDDRIATLARFVEIGFAADSENRVDGAIARPIEPATSQVVWNTRDIGAETPARMRSVGEADIGLAVQKTGRSTEHTEGFVHSLFAAVRVDYDSLGSGVFVDQIIILQPQEAPRFSAGGDSGSLVYDSDRRCIGLLFAGGEATANDPATTVINPIGHVLSELNIAFLEPGEFPSAREA
jgi:hypothetical protein